jgi:pimeloyl-ACP methyl ester carboxylesterase
MSYTHRGGLALALAVTLAAAAVPLSPPAAPAAAQAPTVDWVPCFFEEAAAARAETGDESIRFECAEVPVPLDYDLPEGQTITIALTRLPARRPARAIGSLFVNPGGPGASGVDFVVGNGPTAYHRRVRDRFDLVGFDPRGVARSAPLRCFADADAWLAAQAPDPYPVTRRETRQLRRANRTVSAACADVGAPLAAHLSTANVARDLDRLRAAAGEDALSFVGYSYGSFLGVTYANLYPERVRAMVLDGVVDPIAWSTGRDDQAETTSPLPLRLRSAVGAQATLRQFFRQCDAAGAACAFSGRAATRYAELLDAVRAQPIRVEVADGSEVLVTEQVLVVVTLRYLYDSLAWGEFADVLDLLARRATGRGRADDRLAATLGRFTEDVRYPGSEATAGVACSETANPREWATWVARAEQGDNLFRRAAVFGWSICASWRFTDEDRFTGPYTVAPAAPVMVMSTRFDPATPHGGARRVARLVPGARLFTVEGWGHTTLYLAPCAATAVADYLVELRLPPVDAPCAQDAETLFATADRSVADQARATAVRIMTGG